MKSQSLSALLMMLLITMSCKEATTPSKNTAQLNQTNQEHIITPSSIDKLTAQTTKTELLERYEDHQVQEEIVYSYEGIDVMGTKVHADQPSLTYTIEWRENMTPKTVRISEHKSIWKTKDDLQIGSTIGDVQRSNGTSFEIYGFEIDNNIAGTIKNWNNGNLAGFNLQFEPTEELPAEDYMKIIGDDGIKSDDPILSKAGLVVKQITIGF